jgi:hypothetical protein
MDTRTKPLIDALATREHDYAAAIGDALARVYRG